MKIQVQKQNSVNIKNTEADHDWFFFATSAAFHVRLQAFATIDEFEFTVTAEVSTKPMLESKISYY